MSVHTTGQEQIFSKFVNIMISPLIVRFIYQFWTDVVGLQVQREASNMVLEKRLLKRRHQWQQNDKEGSEPERRNKIDVKKLLERAKSLADVTKRLKVTHQG